MTKPRCVVDTNVLISGALSKHGKPRKVVDFIDASGIILSSQATFEEFETRIRRKKFDKYFVDPHERKEYIDWMYSLSYPFVEITKEIAECPDPNDDMLGSLVIPVIFKLFNIKHIAHSPVSPIEAVGTGEPHSTNHNCDASTLSPSCSNPPQIHS